MSILRFRLSAFTSLAPTLTVIVALVFLLSTFPAAAENASSESEGFATVGDTRMYYEIRGEGKPLLLIMGLGGHILD
jgi:hypothetical protein